MKSALINLIQAYPRVSLLVIGSLATLVFFGAIRLCEWLGQRSRMARRREEEAKHLQALAKHHSKIKESDHRRY